MRDVELYLRKANGHEYFVKADGKTSIFKDKPTLLCCGSVECTHDHTEKANGYAKKADALLNTIDVEHILKPFQVASVTYAAGCAVSESIRAYNRGDMPPTMFKEFVDEQLIPLIVNENDEKLPVNEVKHNFRNIQVLAHSFGGIFIQQVGNLLVAEMEKRGFTSQEIEDCTKQVVVVTAGTVADLHKSKAHFTTLNILHCEDAVARDFSKNIAIGRTLAGLRDQEGDALAAIPFKYNEDYRSFEVDPTSNQLLLFTGASPLNNHTAHRFNDAKRGYKRAESEDEKPEQLADTTFHKAESYFDYGFAKDGFMLRLAASAVLHNALNNSVYNYWNRQREHELPPQWDVLLASPAKGAFDCNVDPDSREAHMQPKAYAARITDSEYQFDPERDFTIPATAVAYDDRIKDALEATHRYKIASDTPAPECEYISSLAKWDPPGRPPASP